jgi:orotidine-5'-phosphate decarboxylase
MTSKRDLDRMETQAYTDRSAEIEQAACMQQCKGSSASHCTAQHAASGNKVAAASRRFVTPEARETPPQGTR